MSDLSRFASFADLLSTWLLDERLSFAQAADRLCVSPSTIAGWRAGRNCPTGPVVKRVAPLLGLDAADLQCLVDRSVTCDRQRLDEALRHAACILGVDPIALSALQRRSQHVAAAIGS